MIQSERRRQTVELVQHSGSVTVVDLCKHFNVSEMTIRRDLHDLDREGLLRRVHGGAVSSFGRSYEPPYQIRTTRQVEAKRVIGRKAAELIVDGDSIGIDVGTTTLEMVHALHGKRNLTIITFSVPIANVIISRLSLSTDVRLILTGGIVRPGELSLIGDLAARVYDEFHVDKAFIGVGGVSLEDGLTEYNIEDASVKKHMIKNARKKIVMADASKLGRTTFAFIAPLSDIDMIITDKGASKEILRAFREKGIEIVIADSSE